MTDDQIYINLFFHVEDYYNPDLSVYALKRVGEILSRHHMQADFYFSGLTAQNLQQRDAELVGRLLEIAGGIGYHGDLHVPGTSPQERIRGMDWDRAVQEICWIETHNVDKPSFEIRDGRWPTGGLAVVERVFGKAPVASVGGGVATLPQVIFVHKKMGVKIFQTVNPVFAKQSTFFN